MSPQSFDWNGIRNFARRRILKGIPQKGGGTEEFLDGKPHASRLKAPALSPASMDFVISSSILGTLTGHTKRG